MDHTRTKLLPIGIGVFVALIAIVGIGYSMGIVSRAEDTTPRDVIISEITQNSAKIVWTTGQQTQGVIEYGTSPTNLNFFAPESEKSADHTIDVTLLSPATTYYFQIRVADKKYDNSGVPWTFTTKSAQAGDSAEETTDQGDEGTTSGGTFTTSPTCNETDCEKIKQKFFSGCDTQDYIKCIKAKDASAQ